MERDRDAGVQCLEKPSGQKGQQAYNSPYLVLIRPHWGKEWDFYPEVKEHVFKDELFKDSIRRFLKDYEEIAKLKNFDHETNLKTFSNEIYRELLNNAIEREEQKIK